LPRFFISHEIDESYTLTGESASHAIKSLRMQTGETLTLCSPSSTDYLCEIVSVSKDCADVRLLSKQPCQNEPDVKITLYQGLPKGDKLDFTVMKAVETGVCEIVPVITARSISRPDAKASEKKLERLQKIALEAAMQCGRGIIPTVKPIISFSESLKSFGQHEMPIVFYEMGGQRLAEIMTKKYSDIAIFIGPEGGFEPDEIASLVSKGAKKATLGNRILRTETAPIVAVSALMFITGNL